jgi:hypothetical protein
VIRSSSGVGRTGRCERRSRRCRARRSAARDLGRLAAAGALVAAARAALFGRGGPFALGTSRLSCRRVAHGRAAWLCVIAADRRGREAEEGEGQGKVVVSRRCSTGRCDRSQLHRTRTWVPCECSARGLLESSDLLEDEKEEVQSAG